MFLSTSSFRPLYRTGRAMAAVSHGEARPEDLEDLSSLRTHVVDTAAPRRVYSVQPRPETDRERELREAFFSQRGPTQPPGGKAGAWARRMAGKAVGL